MVSLRISVEVLGVRKFREGDREVSGKRLCIDVESFEDGLME